MLKNMAYRLALDLGSTSLGWAMIRLDKEGNPCAVIKAGVRIFSDGRNPKDGSSLAVNRREARAMRRRRDRLLKRKSRMINTLINHHFFPSEIDERKELETLNPYELRARGLDEALTPSEFARALFHINQRRGFKSNRKTDKADNDSGALKSAIRRIRNVMEEENCRTIGEWLNKRNDAKQTVRARYRETKLTTDEGKSKIEKSYDLYIDRAMIENEFDLLWKTQAQFNPQQFNEQARLDLKDALLFQRNLKPVKPGRCSLLPEEERAALALPSTQRFRIYQEVNHLRLLQNQLQEQELSLEQRDIVVNALEKNGKRSFTQIKTLLGLNGMAKFSIEDEKRTELKGNTTSALLSKKDFFGEAWFQFDDEFQDLIVQNLLIEENESKLIQWLQQETHVDELHATKIANASLAEGYGSLSKIALARILPALQETVITYDKAVIKAGFDHHSQLHSADTGEILEELPYYGKALQRHVGFGTGNPEDNEEKRYGKIANPTVHIGLNQVRLITNALIKKYGHPSEVIVEVARELKQSKEQRDNETKRQAENQNKNKNRRKYAAELMQISEERVRISDLQKMILWEELSFDLANRRCPYSGVQISAQMLYSDEVEIEHILPFSQTLDDSLANRTLSMRQANRIKGNANPWDAFGKQNIAGFDYEAIVQRANLMPKNKRYRFGPDGMQQWLKEDDGFLARALNDTRHLSKIAREYMKLICPRTRVIPGQMTAMLRNKFGLNDIISVNGEKNRHDHRHHAIDACVIGVTDQRLLQKFSQASASAREKQCNRLVETMPQPWETYREHVQRAIERIWVSHKPDHSFEGKMFEGTSYGINKDGSIKQKKKIDSQKDRFVSYVVPISEPLQIKRHGTLEDGSSRPYKAYQPEGNYCLEILKTPGAGWEMEVIPTFKAYFLARKLGWGGQHNDVILKQIYATKLSNKEGHLIIKLVRGDTIRLNYKNKLRTLRVIKMSIDGGATFTEVHESNVSARYEAKRKAKIKQKTDASLISLNPEETHALNDEFILSQIGINDLLKGKARKVIISPIGQLIDTGFKN